MALVDISVKEFASDKREPFTLEVGRACCMQPRSTAMSCAGRLGPSAQTSLETGAPWSEASSLAQCDSCAEVW